MGGDAPSFPLEPQETLVPAPRWISIVAALVPLALLPLAPAHAAPAGDPVTEESTDRLIVRYQGSPAPAQRTEVLEQAGEAAGVSAAGATEELKTVTGGAVVVELAEDVPLETARRLAEEVAADPEVAWAQPDRRVATTLASPSDPGFRHQWSLQQLKVPTAWSAATGTGTVVGVIDTGITAHPDLAPHVAGGFDFIDDIGVSGDYDGRDADYSDPGDHRFPGVCGPSWQEDRSTWHGTHVAGIIAATANNAHAGAGVAPDARLLIGRALGQCGTGWESDVVDALRWMSGGAVLGVPAAPVRADVVNLSLTMSGECGYFLQEAVNTATAAGVTVVAAAGNDAAPASGYALADCHNVITVGATGPTDERAGFSNYGPGVDVWAPGVEIYSTYNTGTRTPGRATAGYLSGTSMAAPFVAGLTALLHQQHPEMTPAQLELRLKSTATLSTASRGRRVDPVRTLGAPPLTAPFADISVGRAFYNEMVWVAEQGISKGWAAANGTRAYRPGAAVDRDTMAAFLYRAAGSPAYAPPAVSPFADVPTSHAFYKEISWMRAAGVSTGWSGPDGTRLYRPGAPVTREAMAAFLYRAAGSPAYMAPARSPFRDVRPGQVFYREIAWMHATGISTGWHVSDGTRAYRPAAWIRRDAMAAFLFRLDGAV